MRQLLLIGICFFGLNSFAQNYTYSFKFEEVTDQNLAKEAMHPVAQIFDDQPRFSFYTSTFIIHSTIDISEADFIAKMLNQGYHVISFEKNSTKIEEEESP